MLTSIILAASLAIFPVLADVVPLEPAPGEIYDQGGTCHIVWTADTTGQWKEMAIQLMSGSNAVMSPLSTIAIVDGTDATNTTLDYPCLSVTPNSPIYFYQFTAAGAVNTTWTGRFAIADAQGNTTPPADATQPDGEAIPWGLGVLTDPSQAVPPPSFGSPSSSGVIVPPIATSSAAPTSVVITGGFSTPVLSTVSGFSSAPVPTVSPVVTQSNSTGTSTTGDDSTTGNANSATTAFKACAAQTMVALLAPALLFVTMF